MTDEIKIDRWQIQKETVNFSSRVWELRTRKYYHPKRKTSEDFYYISSPDWVVGVGRTVNKEIILVRQFRWGIDDFSLELPGGIIDPNEDPLEAGVREFKEETDVITTTNFNGFTITFNNDVSYADVNATIANNDRVVQLIGCF